MPTKMDLLLTRLGVPKDQRLLANAAVPSQDTRPLVDLEDDNVLFPRLKWL